GVGLGAGRGAARGAAGRPSQSLRGAVGHVTGLTGALPAAAADAKGMMKTAIRDDNPVVVIEDKMDYAVKGEVPGGDDFTIPFGVAEVKRTGEDVTIVATSSMVRVALAAAEQLEADGISAEVVDPRTLSPLDEG